MLRKKDSSREFWIMAPTVILSSIRIFVGLIYLHMKHFLNFLRSKSFLINLGLAALATVLLCFGALQWLKSSTNHGEFVEVPDLSKNVRDGYEESNRRGRS